MGEVNRNGRAGVVSPSTRSWAAYVDGEIAACAGDTEASDYDLGLWNDRQAQAFRRLTTFLRDQGTVPGIQLVHAGRKGSTGRPWPDTERMQNTWPTVGASAVPFGRLPVPAELSPADIAGIVDSFAQTARPAATAGFQVLELHGAHGYLIHQFLSPHSNTRTDRYGGPLENRIRFALDVVSAVRKEWPQEPPLFFRASATDWLGGDTDDTRDGWNDRRHRRPRRTPRPVRCRPRRRLHRRIRTRRAHPRRTRLPVPFAARIRREAGIPTAAVGLITDPNRRRASSRLARPTPCFWDGHCCATRRGSIRPPTGSGRR